MKDLIKNEIKRYFKEGRSNWFEEIKDTYYEEPIIQFADADDSLFHEYKKVIGEHHFTPKEAFELEFGEDSYTGGTVISVVLPINEKTRKSNRGEAKVASKQWTLSRTFGDEVFIRGFVKHLEDYISKIGYKTIAPQYAEGFQISVDALGPTSNWSERHIAYVAGLGTFSLNDGFITEKGIAIRLVSLVTELKITPDVRNFKSHTDNCLLCSKGICAACIKRCPVGAISKEGHDKIKCYKYVYSEESKELAVKRGGSREAGSGCGLCQTNVPCEGRNPMRI